MSQEDKPNLSTRPPPPLRAFTPGPPNSSNDFLREQIQKQQTSNFHSSSLNQAISTVGMVSQQNVNRTALHPGGVQYVLAFYCLSLQPIECPTNVTSNRPQIEHTDLEEELHERAHIDYDRVSIVSPQRMHVVSPIVQGTD